MKRILLILMLSVSVLSFGCNKKTDFHETVEIPLQEEMGQESVTLDDVENTKKDIVEEKNEIPDGDELTDKDSEEVPQEDISTPTEESKPEVAEPEPSQDVTPETTVKVEEIKLTTYSVSLNIGEKKMPIVTMYPQNAPDKREIWVSSNSDVATVDGIGNIRAISEGECTVTVTSVDNPDVSATVSVTVKTAKEYECTYIDGILVVNKTYPLPRDYAPGWETEASGPLWEMIAAAKEDGITLWMKSGYRSYYDQEYIYNGYVKRDGQEEADKYSARPGHSEHQTGLAYDLNSLDVSFGDTPEGKWIADNCYKYGFILRYPKDKEEITGYMYEPWHVRYVGVEKAKEIFESGLCLEEFLNITSVYSY